MNENIEALREKVQELSTRVKSLEMLMDELPDIVYIKDIKGHFVEANLACARYMGGDDYLPADIIGKTDYDFYPEGDADRFRIDELKIIKSGNAILNKDEPRIRNDGRESWILSSKYPVRNDDGNVIGVLGVSHDISDFKISQTNAMIESRLQATATLAGGIAHKFNNLMAIIMGQASSLLEESDRKELHDIEEAAAAAGELAHQMLAFARGGKILSLPVNINNEVREHVAYEKKKIKDRINFIMNLDSSCVEAHGDPRQFEMVISALLSNAIEAIQGAGTITIETHNADSRRAILEPNTETLVSFVRLMVEDDGCGMADEILTRVFEPFFTTKFQGRGLGLAAVHGIIANHSGHISVESIPGSGTTFTVYFPVKESEKKEPIAPRKTSVASLQRGSETIMVVDDETDVRELFAMMLQKLGYTTITASNGLQAVEILQDRGDQVDIVVLDLEMPVMDGRQAYRIMKDMNPGTKILICSGYGLDEETQRLIDDAGDRYLMKPASLRTFSNEVRSLLDTKKSA